MHKFYIPILSALLLTSCAYTFDKTIQPITIKTPGAQGAVCHVYVDGLRHRMKPPQTININKSKEDLIVECLAPGNRAQTVVIEPAVSDNAFLNTFTGIVPGLAWDSASGALYEYPSIVYVDFTNLALKPEPLPAQNNPDIRQPEEYNLEEFRSKQPRLNSDKYAVPVEIQKRQPQQSLYSDTYTPQVTQPALPSIAPVDLDAMSSPAPTPMPSNKPPAWVK